MHVVGIYTCKAHLESRVAALRATWLTQPPPPHVALRFFLAGDGVADRVDGEHVWLACSDGYRHLARKTWRMLRFALDNYEFDRFVKIDDDVYVPSLVALLDDLSSADYTGFLRHGVPDQTWHYPRVDASFREPVPASHFPSWFMSGSVYSLSRRLMEAIVSIPEESIPHLVAPVSYEDVMVGWLVNRVLTETNTSFSMSHQPRLRSVIHCGIVGSAARATCSTALLNVKTQHMYTIGRLQETSPAVLRMLGGMWLSWRWCSRVLRSGPTS